MAYHDYHLGRIFCIGRNYAEHAQELKNDIPSQPVVFMKPSTALVYPGQPIVMPTHGKDLQHEAEIVIKINQSGRASNPHMARSMIAGLSLGLDLTLRDVQTELKRQGLPWETAKSFDNSAPVGYFTPLTPRTDLNNIEFTCEVNGEVRQTGNSFNMLFSIENIIIALSQVWKLKAGDLIFTGTPAGVGPLKVGDLITVQSALLGRFSWKVSSPG